MLSRVADALFWMSRYLERAEQTARLLDVTFLLELDLHGVLAVPAELEWTTLLSMLQQSPPEEHPEGETVRSVINRWLTVSLANPNSIRSCVQRSRNNARSIRGTINSSMWRELNKLYWHLSDELFLKQTAESPHEFCEATSVGSQLINGICDATLVHDEGWHFIQLGKFLERAERTLRILDVKYHLLMQMEDPADLPVTNLQWGAVLKSCEAFEAYQRVYISRIEPERVVEFLLTNPDFPHSVRFCCETALKALKNISSGPLQLDQSPAERSLGRMLSELQYFELEEIQQRGLHEFLQTCALRCQQASAAILSQYALH